MPVAGGSGEHIATSLAEDVARHLYDMARLGVGLEPNELAGSRPALIDGCLDAEGL